MRKTVSWAETPAGPISLIPPRSPSDSPYAPGLAFSSLTVGPAWTASSSPIAVSGTENPGVVADLRTRVQGHSRPTRNRLARAEFCALSSAYLF
jgi:hypothetical protein